MKPPASETELLQHAEALSGMSLRALASRLDVTVPSDPKRAKGWVGELLEREFGGFLGPTVSLRQVPLRKLLMT